MTVLFLSRFFYPHIGGVEKHIEEVGKRLIKYGHTVSVVSEKTPNTYKKNNLFKFKIFYIPITTTSFFKKFTIWYWLWKHRKLMQTADVIHCHDVFFWYLPFRFLYFKKPVYTTFHGYESYPIKKKAIIVRKIAEYLSYGNICIGMFITKWYKTNPTYISFGGVNLPRNKSDYKDKYSAAFIGRLDDQTGILTYTDAIKKIKKSIPRFRLTVFGDGNYKELVEKEANVYGFKENAGKYLNNYHFAFVSRYLAILEAFAQKRLVFAVYDNPLKKDYLMMTPFANFIITASSPVLLARKVLYYIEHSKEEKKITELAYRWVTKQTWEKLTDTYLSLWK